MKQSCYLRLVGTCERLVRLDPGDRNRTDTDRENIVELSDKVRQETERFINGNIHDSTKGWPVLSRIPRRSVA